MASDPDETVVPEGKHPEFTPGSTTPIQVPSTLAPGELVGPYKLIRFVSEGGMGEVWQAERRDTFLQRVAIKFMSPGGTSPREAIARFEQEREMLGALSHEGIARIYDGGIHVGRPWFAMEFVDGEPITEYCDRRRLGITARLALFQQVCEAVTHAHRRGIIHRDLKPTNILVGEGTGSAPRAKVIDFGIAKAMARRLTDRTSITIEHRPIGTLEYMSPEQVDPGGRDIDTRTDVYSLGIVLYEILAGVKPFDLVRRADDEVRRIIRDEDAPSPSTRLSTAATRDDSIADRVSQGRREEVGALIGKLRSELEWIPLMAIRKERDRRYSSPEQMSDDILRYLRGEPLVAAPESRSYRVRKFARRNRATLTAALAVMVALAVGLAVAAWQWRSAETARADEQRRADELRQVSEFQVGMLGEIDIARAGGDMVADLAQRLEGALSKSADSTDVRTARLAAFRNELTQVNATDAAATMIRRTVLEPAERSIEDRFAGQPLVAARLRHVLAKIYGRLGLYDEAIRLQQSVIDGLGKQPGTKDEETVLAVAALGEFMRLNGQFAEAEPIMRDALRTSEAALGPDHDLTIECTEYLGMLLQELGRYDEAEHFYKLSMEQRLRLLGPDHQATIACVHMRGILAHVRNHLDEAELLYRDAMERQTRVLGPGHPDTIASSASMASLLGSRGRHAEAEGLFRNALQERERTLGRLHPSTIALINDLGVEVMHQGRHEEAERVLRDALGRYIASVGPDHPGSRYALNNLGIVLVEAGKPEDAVPHFRQALDIAERTLGAQHPDTLLGLANLGEILRQMGDLSAAENALGKAVRGSQVVLGDGDRRTIGRTVSLAEVISAQGRHAEAMQIIIAAERSVRVAGVTSDGQPLVDVLLAAGSIAASDKSDTGRFAAAEEKLTDALEACTASEDCTTTKQTQVLKALASLHDEWETAQPGRDHRVKADEWRRRMQSLDPGRGAPK